MSHPGLFSITNLKLHDTGVIPMVTNLIIDLNHSKASGPDYISLRILHFNLNFHIYWLIVYVFQRILLSKLL